MVTKWFDKPSVIKKAKSDDNNNESKDGFPQKANETESDYKIEIKWRNVFIFLYLHAAAIYGFMLPKLASSLAIGWILGALSALGTTVGAHRLYTHRTFKANLKMRIMLVIMQTSAAQNDMIEWVRDHRVHHKFTDTNADPHNSKRGFFFCHMGWLMCKKHPDVKKFGSKIDMSDLENDPLLQLQRKYYVPAALFLNFIFPVILCCSLGESFTVAWNGNIFRYLLGLHLVWCINSVCHIWGHRPFDKSITPTDSYFMGFIGFGEGWHNYHHCFPWDYKTSELPTHLFNFSTAFIDFFASLGWATDLKTVPADMINSRVNRTGDGSHPSSKSLKKNKESLNQWEDNHDSNNFWGFGDKEMTEEDMKKITIIRKFQA